LPVSGDSRVIVAQSVKIQALTLKLEKNNNIQEVVGLLPAAGQGNRIAPLPCSKEIYPVGYRLVTAERETRPKVACHYLLEKMRLADITKAYIVIREGKWDIPAYLCDGSMLDMHLAYLIVGPTAGPPYTLDEAYPFVRDVVVAFGFPDILFEGDKAFGQLLSQQAVHDADIVLGLFPADRPEKMDMIELGENGRVTDLVIQPRQTQLQYSWDAAVWTPAFTEFMHSYLAQKTAAASHSEFSVGHVIQAAIRDGLKVEGVPVSDKPYLDIGTPEGLTKAIKRYSD
jgi:glucose-1-phosphate thymidylyltransferase